MPNHGSHCQYYFNHRLIKAAKFLILLFFFKQQGFKLKGKCETVKILKLYWQQKLLLNEKWRISNCRILRRNIYIELSNNVWILYGSNKLSHVINIMLFCHFKLWQFLNTSLIKYGQPRERKNSETYQRRIDPVVVWEWK